MKVFRSLLDLSPGMIQSYHFLDNRSHRIDYGIINPYHFRTRSKDDAILPCIYGEIQGRHHKWERHVSVEKLDRYICKINGGFGQSLRDLEMMVQIACTGALETVGWTEGHGLIRCTSLEDKLEKRSNIRSKWWVRKKQGSIETMAHFISSKSM